MEIGSRLLKQIDEVRYLTAENAWRYRAILRFFYLQYEKMKYWMYKEELFEELKNHREFSEYAMEALKQDLDVLVQWRNLIPVQDTSRVSTVEEFKNKQFRYQLSEYSVEIERLTIRLENLLVESASLEPSLLERIRMELERFHIIRSSDLKTVGSWWNSLNSDFKRLNQNYQDYIRDFYSLKAEDMMKTKEFLVFKDKFIDYLRDFIKGLQLNSAAIESILKQMDVASETEVLQRVFEFERGIPRMDYQEGMDSAIQENIGGRWESLKNWFLGDAGRESEAARLLDITNEIIRKITRYASQISESRNSAANRKEEYKKICSLFLDCKTMDEAHKLSAVCFGIQEPRHIRGGTVRKTESINSGMFEEEAFVYTVKPRIRNYREKSVKSAITDHSAKKAESREKIIRYREEEQRIIEGYMDGGWIDFSKLPLVAIHVRTTLLRWLSKGVHSPGLRSKTEYGRTYTVIPPQKNEQPCHVECEDGTLQMPAYKLKFEPEVKE